jgi:hypothetical protein
MNEVYMFLIIFGGVLAGNLLGEAIKYLVASKSADRLFKELDALEQAHRRARERDIELLNRTINFEKHDRKKRQRRKKNEKSVSQSFSANIKTK